MSGLDYLSVHFNPKESKIVKLVKERVCRNLHQISDLLIFCAGIHDFFIVICLFGPI